MWKTDQPDPAIRQQPRQPRRIKMPGFRVDLPLADLDPFIAQTPPGAGIGLVILICHHNCLARLQRAAKGLGQYIGVGGGGRPETDLMGCNTHQTCQT